jgi:hypothetical protein
MFYYYGDNTKVYLGYSEVAPAFIDITDLAKDDIVKLFDTMDKDGNDVTSGATADSIIDFILKTSK